MTSGPVTNREREEMRRLRALNMPVETIGMRLGRSGRCVHEHVRDMPVRCKPGGPGFGSERYRRLLAAAEAGADPSDLAEHFGLSRNSVAPTLSRIRRAQRLAQEHAPC